MVCLIKKSFIIISLIGFSLLTYLYLYEQYNYLTHNDELISEVLGDFAERNQHLDVECYNHRNRRYGVQQFNHVLRKMFIDTVHNISWCPVYKSGSTAWLKAFAQLGHVLDDHTLKYLNKNVITWNMVARKAFPTNGSPNEIYYNFNKTKAFLIVRHPFDRILAMYRSAWDPQSNKGTRKNLFYKEQPSFGNFLITLVANFSAFDDYWSPIYKQCLPCTFQYKYIIKTESVIEDTQTMITELGLSDLLDLQLLLQPIEQEVKIVKYHFSSVHCEILRRVYQLYKEDFIFFNYSPDIYYILNKC